jgi:hypothetical protein
MEDELFSLWVKQDIMVLPMKDYIEDWLKRLLTQITNPE